MKIFNIFSFIFCFIFCLFTSYSQNLNLKLVDAKSNNFIFTDELNHGIYYYNQLKNETVNLNNSIGSSYKSSLSPDGKYIAYKNIELKDDISYQTPMLFDIEKNEFIPLSKTSIQAGVPSFSQNGDVAFTVGKDLFILDNKWNVQKKINLENYVNLPALSPDGRKIALNDENDQIYILDVQSNIKTLISDNSISYFEPLWSNGGDKIAYKSIASDIFVYNLNSGKNIYLGKGASLSWDKDDLYFIKLNYNNEARLLSSIPMKYDFTSGMLNKLDIISNDQNIKSLLFKENLLFYTSDKNDNIFYYGKQSKIDQINKIQNISFSIENAKILVFNAEKNLDVQKTTADKFIARFDSVYFNQVYDIRPDRSGIGSGCCGAASSLMGLMFYNILPVWGTYCNSPSYHFSPYANYITEIYTFNATTYDISYARGSGSASIGWGIYGWIYRNSLEDTKGHMASLLCNHGLSSSVDWSPEWSKVQQEIDKGFPFVLLNSLTDAGHYIVWTGYVNENRTGIFNDPYGNRNYASYLRDKAIRVKYDWPGYSNGYANLNSVWCFIYMRTGSDISITKSNLKYEGAFDKPAAISYEVRNVGMKDINSPFKIKVYLSNDDKLDPGDSVIFQKTYLALSTKDTINEKIAFYFPKSTTTKSYYVFIKADEDNQVSDEVSKTNNNVTLIGTVIGRPDVTLLYPYPNTTMTFSKPAIYVTFDTTQRIDTSSIIVKVNETDVSPQVLKWNYKIIFYPQNPYDLSTINASIYLKNKFGYDSTFKWTFYILNPTKVITVNQMNTFQLYQNYPNPFNPTTNIKFNLDQDSQVKIVVFDYLGREIQTLLNEFKNSGEHNVYFDAGLYPSGIYYYRIITSNYSQMKKMLLIK